METGNATRARDVQVKFLCPCNGWAGDTRELRALAEEIDSAIAAIKSHGFRLRPNKKLRYRWTLDFDSYDLSLSEQDVRKAMSAVEACIVDSVRLTFYSLPILRRPRKPVQAPVKAAKSCDCEEFFCEHYVPRLSSSERLADWRREDARERQRRSRNPDTPDRKRFGKPSGHRAEK